MAFISVIVESFVDSPLPPISIPQRQENITKCDPMFGRENIFVRHPSINKYPYLTGPNAVKSLLRNISITSFRMALLRRFGARSAVLNTTALVTLAASLVLRQWANAQQSAIL